MAFVFSREGPVEEFGALEELAEAPEAIEMHVVLWHVARCTGAEDWSEQLRTLAEELRTLEELEQLEELAVRALKNLALRALKMKHLAYEHASLTWPSSACLQRPQQW